MYSMDKSKDQNTIAPKTTEKYDIKFSFQQPKRAIMRKYNSKIVQQIKKLPLEQELGRGIPNQVREDNNGSEDLREDLGRETGQSHMLTRARLAVWCSVIRHHDGVGVNNY